MRIAMLFAAALLGSACTDQVDQPGLGESSQSVIANNRLASNRLASNRLASNHLQAESLALGDLIETVDGRDLLDYVISCALPDGTTLTATDSLGNSYDFFGALGLAPKWIDQPLDRQGRRWVSACLFSRVNALNVAVPISMRGAHDELAVTPDEVASWPLQEGAFWGDWFVPEPAPLQWFACRGVDKVATPTQGGLAERECTDPDPANPGHTICGFIDAGDCGDYAPPRSAHACNHFSSHGYWISCTADPRGGGHLASGADASDDDDGDVDDLDGGNHASNGFVHGRYHQVITTYIQ